MEHSSKWRGTVKGMRENYDDTSKVDVEVELPAPKKVAKAGKSDAPTVGGFKPCRTVTVSPEMAATLSVGDPVECQTTLRPFGKREPLVKQEKK